MFLIKFAGFKVVIVHKKIILFIFSVIFLASCGVRKTTVSPVAKSDGVQYDILDYGMEHLNKPYRYAGKGPNSFDCSGFTSFVFRKYGYRLSTSSSGQARQVPSIDRKEDLRIGDLVFFEGRPQNGNVGHVGIVKEVLPNGNFTFLHASTSYGVIVSRSTEPYYAVRYLHGGRVIKENNHVVLAKRNAKPVDEAPSAKELIRTKSKTEDKKEPVVVKAPKTITEKELELSNNVVADNTVARNDSVIIHTRQIALPVSGQPAKESSEKEATISKAATRVNNRGVPKPKTVNNEGGKDPLQYKVMPGDTLYSISRQHSCSIDQIKEWNPHLDNNLRAGETINIYQ